MKYNVKRHAVVQPSDQSIRLIPLTQGKNAIVDAADYEWLMKTNWHARKDDKTGAFYAETNIYVGNGKCDRGYMARFILDLGLSELADHVNGNTLDNRRCNLRASTKAQNRFNSKKPSCNSSGYKWVTKRYSGWAARVTFRGVLHELGTYATPLEAHEVAYDAAKRFHGEFARPV